MATTDRPYYRDQLNFLREGGLAMARAHPRDADMLAKGLDDPDVERLLEGIAYFVGKITEKQVQNLSQLCQFLFDILFPHYLCPVPATAVVEFAPAKWPETVPRGTAIDSVPIRGTSCSFRTAYDVEVGPVSVEHVAWNRTAAGGQLAVELGGFAAHMEHGAPQEDRVRLHLHGDPKNNAILYHWLCTHLEEIEVTAAAGHFIDAEEPLSLHPVGFADDEALFPYPLGSFAGFRLLQEYFTLPAKFLFLDLRGLWAALTARGEDEVPDRVTVHFNLKLDRSRNLMVSKQHVRTGCTPVVNIFEQQADPVKRSPAKAEFPLRPSGFHRHREIYRVLDVYGHGPDGWAHYPVLSEVELEKRGASAQVFRRSGADGRVDSYVYLTDPQDALPPSHQTLLVDLLCSNGWLASGLQVGDLNRPQSPYDSLSCRNITKVTPSAPVPMGEELRQRLVSHLALTQLDLASHQGLYESINLYNPKALIDQQARWAHQLILDGLLRVRSEEVMTLEPNEALPVRGRSTLVELGEGTFDSEGDLYLFGCVLNELVALQTPINWYSEFSIRWTKTKALYQWPKRLGRETLTV